MADDHGDEEKPLATWDKLGPLDLESLFDDQTLKIDEKTEIKKLDGDVFDYIG